MIEHVMQAVMNLAEHVWVLAQGQLIAEGHAGRSDDATSKRDRGLPRPRHGRAAARRRKWRHDGLLLDVKGLQAPDMAAVEVLRGIDLACRTEGEAVALLGSNGAGKSTLNHTVCGLVPAWSGRVRFDGQDITNQHSRRIVQAGLVLVPEGRKIFPNLSVLENLELGAYARASERSRRAANLEKVLTTFPRLAERRSQLAGTMSGGEQQMLAIGRGLMAEPKLLILDEPSLGLSPLLVEELFTLIGRLHAEGLSILLVEQNVGQSLAIAQRAVVLENGSPRFAGTPAELLASDALRRAYLGL